MKCEHCDSELHTSMIDGKPYHVGGVDELCTRLTIMRKELDAVVRKINALTGGKEGV